MAYNNELDRDFYRFDDEYQVRVIDPDVNPAADVPKGNWRFYDVYLHMTFSYGLGAFGEGPYGT